MLEHIGNGERANLDIYRIECQIEYCTVKHHHHHHPFFTVMTCGEIENTFQISLSK